MIMPYGNATCRRRVPAAGADGASLRAQSHIPTMEDDDATQWRSKIEAILQIMRLMAIFMNVSHAFIQHLHHAECVQVPHFL